MQPVWVCPNVGSGNLLGFPLKRIHFFIHSAGAKKSRRRFTEGWVEFKRKHDAKQVAIHLNNQKVGGFTELHWVSSHCLVW